MSILRFPFYHVVLHFLLIYHLYLIHYGAAMSYMIYELMKMTEVIGYKALDKKKLELAAELEKRS